MRNIQRDEGKRGKLEGFYNLPRWFQMEKDTIIATGKQAIVLYTGARLLEYFTIKRNSCFSINYARLTQFLAKDIVDWDMKFLYENRP